MSRIEQSNFLSPDCDNDGVEAFNSMAHEVAGIERLVVQQRDLIKKLLDLLKRTKQSEEKALDKQKYLESDLEAYISKNKLLRENSQSKLATRRMMEQMTCDLERQLHLERNNIQNRAEAFKQTEIKYTEMWARYEAVYMSSQTAVEMVQKRKAREEAMSHFQGLETQSDQFKHNILRENKNKSRVERECVVQLVSLFSKLTGATANVKDFRPQRIIFREELRHQRKAITELRNKLAARKALLDAKRTAEAERMEVESAQTEIAKQKLSFDVLIVPALELPELDEMMEVLLNEPTAHPPFAVEFTAPDYSAPEEGNHPEPVLTQKSYETSTSRCVSFASETQVLSFVAEEEEAVEPMQMEEQMQTPLVAAEAEPAAEQEPLEQPLEETPTRSLLEQTAPEAQAEPESMEQEASQPLSQEGEELLGSQGSQSDGGFSDLELAAATNGGRAPSVISDCSNASSQLSSSSISSVDLLNDETRKKYMRKLMASPDISEQLQMRPPTRQFQAESVNSASNSDYLSRMYQMFNQPSETSSVGHEETSNGDSQETLPEVPVESQKPVERVEVAAPTLPAAPPPPQNLPFSPMSSLFGPPQQQPADQNAFGFGGFSFGTPAPQPTSLFGGGSNLFGDPPAPNQGSETFNMSFNTNSNSSSIFKLF